MHTEAAINGISTYGLGWDSRYRLHFSKYNTLIGEMEDPLTSEQNIILREHCYNIAQHIRDLITKLERDFLSDKNKNLLLDLQMADIYIEDLENIGPNDTVEDVREILSELYDTFDFYRILVE